jgi:hypothetical protein
MASKFCEAVSQSLIKQYWKSKAFRNPIQFSFYDFPNNIVKNWIFQHTVLLKPSWVEENCQRKLRSGMVQGWSQVSQTSFSQILSAPTLNKIFESLCFFSVCQPQGFFWFIFRGGISFTCSKVFCRI